MTVDFDDPKFIPNLSKHTPIMGYKIVDLNKDGSYNILFHGINGTKKITLDKWMNAEVKWAGEGGRKYWTGFHMFTKKFIAKEYFTKFTDSTKKRIIVKCIGMNLRQKKSSNGKVYLANKILIPSKQS